MNVCTKNSGIPTPRHIFDNSLYSQYTHLHPRPYFASSIKGESPIYKLACHPTLHHFPLTLNKTVTTYTFMHILILTPAQHYTHAVDAHIRLCTLVSLWGRYSEQVTSRSICMSVLWSPRHPSGNHVLTLTLLFSHKSFRITVLSNFTQISLFPNVYSSILSFSFNFTYFPMQR